MQEQLINYKTAKLANEKGFDLITDQCYSKVTKTISVSYGDYKAPTQSILQKWLREKHNIHVHLTCLNIPKYHYAIQYLDKSNRHRYKGSDIEVNYTYEQALEIGLQIALNLIP